MAQTECDSKGVFGVMKKLLPISLPIVALALFVGVTSLGHYVMAPESLGTTGQIMPDVRPEELSNALRSETSRINAVFAMRAIVSLLVLIPALFVVLSPNRFEKDSHKWAYGTIGIILGFWLR